MFLSDHLEPHSPHVHLNKVNKSKLNQGHEDKGEADDDVDIQRCGVRDSHFVFLTNKPDRDHGCTGENDPGDCLSEGGRSLTQTAGDAETNPGHDLSPGGGVDQPEGDPGAHDDDGERDVDLEEVEAQGPVEGEVDKYDGLVASLHVDWRANEEIKI